MTKYLKKQKKINAIKETIEDYLILEKRNQDIIDSGADGYGFDKQAEKQSDKMERNIQLQYNQLVKQLDAFGYSGHPVELIDIYSENKLKTIRILEGV